MPGIAHRASTFGAVVPRRLAFSALVALAVTLAACGDDKASGGPGGKALEISDADRARYDLVVEAHDIKFDAKGYDVAAGVVDVAYVEEGDLVHNLVIEGPGETAIPIDGGDADGKLIVTSRSDATGSVTLEPGSYTLICKVVGHADAGMKATLTVR